MPHWEALWCFYNSTAFKPAATVALLGTIGIVIPAIWSLPDKRDPAQGQLHTPFIRFNDARLRTQQLGWMTVVVSLFPPFLYYLVLNRMHGKTCDVNVEAWPWVYTYLYLLYSVTVAVLFLFGYFYFTWQDALRRHQALPNE